MPVCHAAPRASRCGAGVGATTTHLAAASTSTNANASANAKGAGGEGTADEYDFSTFAWVNPRSGLWPS